MLTVINLTIIVYSWCGMLLYCLVDIKSQFLNLENCISVEPNFFSKNHLMLGTTLFRQKKREEAKVWLSKAVNENPLKTKDDEKVCTLAVDNNE